MPCGWYKLYCLQLRTFTLHPFLCKQYQSYCRGGGSHGAYVSAGASAAAVAGRASRPCTSVASCTPAPATCTLPPGSCQDNIACTTLGMCMH